MAEKLPLDRDDEPRVKVRVSTGRTVVGLHPTLKRWTHRLGANGLLTPVEVPAQKTYRQGEIVELPRSEAERLRKQGHVADPSEMNLAPEAAPPALRNDRPDDNN